MKVIRVKAQKEELSICRYTYICPNCGLDDVIDLENNGELAKVECYCCGTWLEFVRW